MTQTNKIKIQTIVQKNMTQNQTHGQMHSGRQKKINHAGMIVLPNSGISPATRAKRYNSSACFLQRGADMRR